MHDDGRVKLESTDGVTIALHDLGGSGQPLLICHATGFLGRAYEPMATNLLPYVHVWALDYRAHGESTAPTNGRFDWEGMTDDLEVAVDAITDEPIALFGHSMGGATAVLLERRRPGTVRCAYLFEPIILSESWVMPPKDPGLAIGARKRRAAFPSRELALERYASRPPLNVLRADALAAYVKYGFHDQPDGTVRLACEPDHEGATFDAPDKPTIDSLGDVGTPITVAIGTTDDGAGPAMLGETIADALPNATLERFRTMSHFGPLEQPAVIAERTFARIRGGD
jgi:pimeloyl-ACP methyl ester carboxylesterase